MPLPARGEIWTADLDPTRGREQAGRRPVLVVSTDRFNQSAAELVVIVPVTSKQKGVPWHVPVRPPEGALRTTSYVMCEAVRCVARERLTRRLGRVQPPTLQEVERRLRVLLEL
jgi:mRNA interferase MazF